MKKIYYKLAYRDPIYEYHDPHQWSIEDEYEREALFIELAADNYRRMPDRWNERGFDVVVICTEEGTPIWAMEVVMNLEPQFEAFEYNKNDL